MCNGCEQKNKCRKIKYYYYSKFANDEYSEKLRTVRYEINLSKEEAYDIDTLITPLIKEKHQSISHIYANHPDEISFSRATMYNYIDLGVFSFRNIELPRKVKYKKREIFKKAFEVILTDNGSEFFNPMSIEKDEETDEIISHIFYYDPGASWQKGEIEKNHEFIRYVLPKGHFELNSTILQKTET